MKDIDLTKEEYEQVIANVEDCALQEAARNIWLLLKADMEEYWATGHKNTKVAEAKLETYRFVLYQLGCNLDTMCVKDDSGKPYVRVVALSRNGYSMGAIEDR